jgi:uncharacterized protein YerC
MTHVSKNSLTSETEKKLRAQFAKFFSNQIPADFENLFSSLYTQSEQMMFLKRLAAIIMLIEGKSTYNIQKTLKISISTVIEIKTKFTLNQYEHLVDRYHDKKFNAEAFIKVIEKILDAGMPSLGKDRWKSLR